MRDEARTDSAKMLRSIIAIVVAEALIALVALGCSPNAPSGKDGYAEVMASENMPLAQARELLSSPSSQEAKSLAEMTSSLYECEGRFIHKNEELSKVYTADVSFYLSNGEPFCHVEYIGYKGELADGKISASADSSFLFEAHTKGKFYSKEHDFTIKFSPEKVYFTWAGSIEHTLERGEGISGEDENISQPFLESTTFKNIRDSVDSAFGDSAHSYAFDNATSTFTIYMEAPAATRDQLAEGSSGILSSWGKLVDSLSNMAGKLYNVVHMGYEDRAADHMDFIIVDSLNTQNSYSTSDFLLRIHDGKVAYNYAETAGKQHPSSTPSSPSANSAPASSNEPSSSANTGHKYTAGQRESMSIDVVKLRVLKDSDYYAQKVMSSVGMTEQKGDKTYVYGDSTISNGGNVEEYVTWTVTWSDGSPTPNSIEINYPSGTMFGPI